MEAPLHYRIRQRAYEIWEAGGRLDGQAEQHWLLAERELLQQTHPGPSEGNRVSALSRQRSGRKKVPSRG